jgi:hypothetical protein
MRNIALLIALAAILSASKVEAGDFYQWTNEDGSISFTDDAKRIPARYKASATERDFAGIAEKRITPHSISENAEALAARLQGLRETNSAPAVNPNQLPDCSGPVTVVRERRQVGEYNRTFYVATDECGNVVYDSPVPVRLRMER